MRTIIVHEYGDESVLKLQLVAKPAPEAGQILVAIKAAGVNPVDTYIREGNHPSAPPVPFTPGKDGAGIVEAVGEGVTKVEAGDRVYLAGALTGTYSEYALCTEEHVWKLPVNASFEQGAALFVPYATAYRAIFGKAELKRGDKILIHGASGAVGIAAIQWAKHAGAEVFGTAGSEAGLDLIRRVGAEHVFDHTRSGYLKDVDDLSEGGVNVILEMLANVNLAKDFDALAKFGTIVIIGSRGSLQFDPRLTMAKEATIKGMSLFNSSKEEFEEIHENIYKGIAEGYLSPVVGKSFPLEDARHAHREIMNGKAFGKIVLSCGND